MTTTNSLIVETPRGPSIAGTRITVYSVMDYIKANRSKEYILQFLRVTPEQLDAAFEYIAYSTGLENSKRVILEFKEESPRQATWSDPEVLAEQPFLPEVAKQYAVGKPFTPGLPQWLELFIALAEGLSSAMSEQATPQDALNTTAQKWSDAINQAKPSFEYKE